MLMSIIRPKTKKGKFVLFLFLVLVCAAVYWFVLRDTAEPAAEAEADPHANSLAANNLNCGLSVPAEELYYISDAPKLKKGNLNYSEFEGEKIKIVGYAYEGENKDVKIPNAKIELWQPDSMGTFYPADSGTVADFGEEQLALRGTVIADKFGYFEFTTIYPGGTMERARHIYLKGSADGYEPVTTQLLMSRSADMISVNDDPIAQELPNCNVLNFGAVEAVQVAGYDLHLQKKPELTDPSEQQEIR